MVSVRWLGHATFLIEGSKRVLIDPFIDGNPSSPVGSAEMTEVDLVVVTHPHDDHLGQALEICERTGATLVGQYEIVSKGMEKGLSGEPMNIGGSVTSQGVTVHLTHAEHTCDWGDATGVILELDGKTIYHTGDTGLFGDMALLGEFFDVDLMLLPIGDRFTMGPRSAAKAVELVGPAACIPMHYGTWPLIDGSPHDFKANVGETARVIILEPGDTHKVE